MRDVWLLLRGVPGLTGAPDGVLQELAALFAWIESRDAWITREGEVGDAVHLLAEGVCAVSTRRPSGEEAHLAHLSAGAFFGHRAVLTGGRHTRSVRGIGRVRTLSMPGAALRQVMDGSDIYTATILRTALIISTARDLASATARIARHSAELAPGPPSAQPD